MTIRANLYYRKNTTRDWIIAFTKHDQLLSFLLKTLSNRELKSFLATLQNGFDSPQVFHNSTWIDMKGSLDTDHKTSIPL